VTYRPSKEVYGVSEPAKKKRECKYRVMYNGSFQIIGYFNNSPKVNISKNTHQKYDFSLLHK